MDADTFIDRWATSGGTERANYVSFLTDLCRVLGVPEPDPTRPNEADNAYVFEKAVSDPHEDGKASTRRIDLYRRGAFVLEDEPRVFPGRLAEQAQAVRLVLLGADKPLGTAEIPPHFTGAKLERVGEILELFVELGQARQLGGEEPRYAA